MVGKKFVIKIIGIFESVYKNEVKTSKSEFYPQEFFVGGNL